MRVKGDDVQKALMARAVIEKKLKTLFINFSIPHSSTRAHDVKLQRSKFLQIWAQN